MLWNRGLHLALVTYILAIIGVEAAPKRYHYFFGPFTIKVQRLTSCPKEMSGIYHMDIFVRDVRTRHDQAVTYSGNVTFPFTMSDALSGRILVASWSNMGGWKDKAHILHSKAVCTVARRLAPKVWEVYMNSVVGEPSMCPYYAGFYRFSNVTADFSKIGISQFFYGRWRADVQMIHNNGEVAACLRAFAETVPV